MIDHVTQFTHHRTGHQVFHVYHRKGESRPRYGYFLRCYTYDTRYKPVPATVIKWILSDDRTVKTEHLDDPWAGESTRTTWS